MPLWFFKSWRVSLQLSSYEHYFKLNFFSLLLFEASGLNEYSWNKSSKDGTSWLDSNTVVGLTYSDWSWNWTPRCSSICGPLSKFSSNSAVISYSEITDAVWFSMNINYLSSILFSFSPSDPLSGKYEQLVSVSISLSGVYSWSLLCGLIVFNP